LPKGESSQISLVTESLRVNMKAIVARQWSDPRGLVLDEVPKPEPGPGQVLVKVASAALNFPDVLMVAGKYQVRPPLPFSPGFEVAGIVESVGAGVDNFV